MRIRKFNERSSFIKPTFKSKIDECVYDIIVYLKDNNILTWDKFIAGGRFDKFVIDKLIDSYCKNINEVNEVKFKLKLELGNESDLQEMLTKYEESEEYEKCSEIKKRLDSL